MPKSKFGYLYLVCLKKNQTWNLPIVELKQNLVKIVKLLTISFDKALIETEIKICTSLKSGFYFRFYF